LYIKIYHKKKKKKFLYNKNITIKNLPKNPNKGGIPAKERIEKINIIRKKVPFPSTLNWFRVLKFFTLIVKIIEKSKNNINK